MDSNFNDVQDVNNLSNDSFGNQSTGIALLTN